MTKIKSKSEERRDEVQKENETFQQKLDAKIAKFPLVTLPGEKELLVTLFLDVYKGYKFNQIVNVYLQVRYVTEKNNPSIIQSLSKVQSELQEQEIYLEYLIAKLS